MGRCTSLIGLKGRGGVGMGYSVGYVVGQWRLRGGSCRSVNEVERVEEGERRGVGYVDQCCRRSAATGSKIRD